MFAVDNCGVDWLCFDVCGCGEVQTVSVYVELKTVFLWDKGTK